MWKSDTLFYDVSFGYYPVIQYGILHLRYVFVSKQRIRIIDTHEVGKSMYLLRIFVQYRGWMWIERYPLIRCYISKDT